ncbi:hypothetical protein SCLCIDRAFT_931312 [Scleroderma citrinum Foug A]|uniref:Uncharacterized protein n=1 Tax=Scleroderma citrinum Foug A TaxID=1036808 RepID=A0A0C3DJE7_9AGAM|nr:hypothetical protein SCLCIDRAFT_931312 [Scleroderma citrinum Foug A]
MLKKLKIFRLSQLASDLVKATDLQSWLGINLGTAILIMQYAKEDFEMGSWPLPDT